MRKELKILFAFTIFLVCGCNDSDNNRNIKSMEEEPDSVASNKASIDSIAIKENKNDSIPYISGSCENGRAIGNMDQYTIKMKVGISPTDSIYVRSDASCFEIKRCHQNILGKIKSGTIIYVQGPLKNRDFSAGIAYAFPVKDKNGNICRGYLSYLNVE